MSKKKPGELKHGGAKLVFESGVYTRGQLRVRLTRKELAVLAILMKRAGRVVSRNTLRDRVFPGKVPQSVDTYVHYLRGKGVDGITMKSGVGYLYCGLCRECRERRHRG